MCVRWQTESRMAGTIVMPRSTDAIMPMRSTDSRRSMGRSLKAHAM